MPKHKKIIMLLFQHIPAVYQQPFLLLTQEILFAVACGRPAFLAEVIGYPYADERWKDTKHPMAYRVSEHLLHGLIPMIARAQSISMPDIKTFAVELKCLWLKINGHIQFLLKILAHPHVMVAYKKMYGNPCICQFCYLS